MPAGFVTLTVPLLPFPTTAVIWVSESKEKLCADTPPNPTAVAPVKKEPVIMTVVPVPPDAGEKPLITGGAEPGIVVVVGCITLNVNVCGPS